MQLIIYGHKTNRYSINALLGALEKHRLASRLPVTVASTPARLQEAIKQGATCNLIAISFFSTQIQETADLVRMIRQTGGDRLMLVAGGAHATGDPAGTLALGFDTVVRGEGEETFPELINALAGGIDLSSVKGIAYRAPSGDVTLTERQPHVKLDDYPPFAATFGHFGPIEITRGCPFSCRFCQTPQLAGAGLRHRSVTAVAEAVSTMHRRKLSDIRVITPNVFAYGSEDGRRVNLAKIGELFHAIRSIIGRQGRFFAGSFPSEVRPEHVSEETLRLLRTFTDNDNIVIGAQSGSQRMLDHCHRGHLVDDVIRAVDLAVLHGYKASVDFIFGLPGETQEDMEQSIEVMQLLAGMGARVHGHTFMPLPGTAFADQPPGRIPPHLRKAVELLISDGMAFGDWKKQEKQARLIADRIRR